jgi:hypothetical protein
MAVGAEQAKIFQSVVVTVAIDVIQLKWDRPAKPRIAVAHGALAFEHTL